MTIDPWTVMGIGDSSGKRVGREAALLGCLVVVVGLVELAAYWFFARRAPDVEAWKSLLPVLENAVAEQGPTSDFRPGKTLVMVAPRWAEPLARLSFGDRWMPLSHVGRQDDERFASAVEVSIVGAAEHRPGWREAWAVNAGKFKVRGLVHANVVPVLYDFVTELGPAAATVQTRRRGAGPAPVAERECRYGRRAVRNGDLHGHPTFPARRFACAGGDWHFVGVTVVEDQHYRPRHCIWAHPGQGEQLVIRYEQVAVGEEIRGYGGLPYFRERQSQGSPVDMEVFVNGSRVGQYRHRDGEGFTLFEFSTAQWRGSTGVVEFRVSAERAAHREFCFQATTR